MTTDRLSRASLPSLDLSVARPAHDVDGFTTGIVHFGPGAFHRAHQAAYIDRVLESDPRWGIAAVSLRSAGTIEALRAQDGLYTLAIVDRSPSLRIIAAHSELIGPGEGAQLRALLAKPTVKIVTSTVTEKGYCLAADGRLDRTHPDIVHDAARPAEPVSVVGWIVAGLADRFAAGTEPYAVLCCDNVADNGHKLRAACVALAQIWDGHLAEWIEKHVAFPNSMVDSITPASDDAFLERVSAQLGVEDHAAVQREQFAQWVLEDFELPGGPDLAAAGVIVTDNVRAYEQAKLRIVNGTHTTLAYMGIALGLETVFEAISDPALERFTTRLVHSDLALSLPAVRGFDPQAYADAVLDRFRNPNIRHLLSQIAWDGSQKLPYRLFDPIREALAAGRPIERLVVPIAAWIAFVRYKAQTGETLTDPLAEQLIPAAMGSDVATAMLALRQIFPEDLASNPRFRHEVTEALLPLLEGRPEALLTR